MDEAVKEVIGFHVRNRERQYAENRSVLITQLANLFPHTSEGPPEYVVQLLESLDTVYGTPLSAKLNAFKQRLTTRALATSKSKTSDNLSSLCTTSAPTLLTLYETIKEHTNAQELLEEADLYRQDEDTAREAHKTFEQAVLRYLKARLAHATAVQSDRLTEEQARITYQLQALQLQCAEAESQWRRCAETIRRSAKILEDSTLIEPQGGLNLVNLTESVEHQRQDPSWSALGGPVLASVSSDTPSRLPEAKNEKCDQRHNTSPPEAAPTQTTQESKEPRQPPLPTSKPSGTGTAGVLGKKYYRGRTIRISEAPRRATIAGQGAAGSNRAFF